MHRCPARSATKMANDEEVAQLTFYDLSWVMKSRVAKWGNWTGRVELSVCVCSERFL